MNNVIWIMQNSTQKVILPGEIKLTFEVLSLPANRPIGVTGVTVTDVDIQKGNPEALNSSLVTEVVVSLVL